MARRLGNAWLVRSNDCHSVYRLHDSLDRSPSRVCVMLLTEVVDVSQQVGSTRSRKLKTELLADLIAQSTEPGVLVALLAGEPRQGKIGVGYAAAYGAEVEAVIGAERHRRRSRRMDGGSRRPGRGGILGDTQSDHCRVVRPMHPTGTDLLTVGSHRRNAPGRSRRRSG